MNKSVLKKFATEARIELLEKVELQARKIGITAESIQEANVESSDAVFIDGKQLSDIERRQRNKLIARINEIGFERVMEETAYTWFNRFIALRYMEVNDYLPTKVRVLSSDSGSAEPDMMKEALTLNLDIDKEKVYEMKMNNETDELFKYLIKMHCNDLNRYMPFMFETIEDYTEILFPEGLLGTDSFVRKMTDTEVIPEDNWEKIEVIGWLYQYYIADEKDKVFANLKKNIKITQDTLPAATQLFTPNWIVRYMVENSLGRIWLESYPESSLKNQWEYYLEEAEQEEEVIKQLEEIRYKNVNPEEITFLDPCCGSGHILVYAFDVFYELYLEKGYMDREIPKLILEKNLFGLDVDNRAVQLASFAVMMKAREKSRRVFRQGIVPNICTIQESNWLTDNMIDKISENDDEVRDGLNTLKENFIDGKEIGSLIDIEELEYDTLEQNLQRYLDKEVDLLEMVDRNTLEEKLPVLIKQARIVGGNYDVVCTNPPYMGRSGMGPKLTNFLNIKYPDSKNDLFAAFIEKSFKLTKEYGYVSLITMESWMFLSSYEKLRKKIISEKTIHSLVHMPYEGRGKTSLGINFGTSAVILKNTCINKYINRNVYIRYNEIDEKGTPFEFPVINNRFINSRAERFNKIPGSPIAYWINESVVSLFEMPFLKEFSDVQEGLKTGDNERFIRKWYEVNYHDSNIVDDTHNKKWIKHTKGGAYRKWYGNNEDLLYFENNGLKLKESKKASVTGEKNYYKENITWTRITSAKISFRYTPEGFIPNMAGLSLYSEENIKLILGYLNSKITSNVLSFMNPTLNFPPGLISNVPYPTNIPSNTASEVIRLTNDSIEISKKDWDAREISWDFSNHPLVERIERNTSYIEERFIYWERYSKKQFSSLKTNEEEINRIFIELFNLKDEFTPEVKNEDITIFGANLKDDIKSFISYAIGCSFGRYSLDEEGLIYAGGEFNSSRYQTFPADEDNILPILSGAYFEDDIVTRFVEFVRVTFSEETLEENLNFVADALGRRKNETARETIRRYFLNDFYKDHVQVYKKRPIYWLFTSGKEKAFNCLIYMHRYDKTTLSRIRTDYLHEVQTRMDAEKNDLLEIINGDSTTREVNNAKRELKVLDRKIDELKKYDEQLHHMADMQIEIDLDDGVKVNYGKFKGLVAKI